MKNQITESTNEQKNHQVVIITRNHLLGYHLSLKFAQSNLSTQLLHLSPSETTFKTLDPKIDQRNKTVDTVISRADYYLLIYPQISDLALINQVIQLTQASNAKLCVIINYRDLRTLQVINSRIPKTLNSRFVVVTDPYGPYFTDDTEPLPQLIADALHQKTLVISDAGKKPLYPTYIGDLTPVILKALFSSGTSNQIFTLSTLESTTNLNAAYQLVNLSSEILNHNLELTVTEETTQSVDLDTDGVANSQNQLSWEPLTDLEAGLRQTLVVAAPPTHKDKPQPKPKPQVDLAKLPPIERKVRRFFNPKAWLVIGFLTIVLSLVALPLILFFVNSYFGVTNLSKAVTDLQQGNTTSSHHYSTQATADFARSRVLLQSSNPLLLVIPNETITQTDKLLDAFSRLSVVISTASNTVSQADQLYRIILGQSTEAFLPAVSQVKTSLDTLYSELSLVKVSLEKIDLSNSFEFFSALSSAKKQVPDMISQLQLGIATLDLLPQLIGNSTPQTYLVLFQNSAELRPTGGFLGAFALVTFQNGRLIDTQIKDVYTADSQLSGHVDPPAAIKKYLGEANWYLRDSNWYPNFPNAARQIQWFVQKEVGHDVQGVFTLNLYSIKDLLQATGPINVADFQENVTSDNLFERVEYRSEVNFFPDNAQKRDFFTALNTQLLAELKSGKTPLSKLVAALDHSLRGRQIFIMSNDLKTQTKLEDLGFAGQVKNMSCPSSFAGSPCTSLTFALIESNLGVNKTNYFISRNIKPSIAIDKDGRISYQIDVNYQNKSESTAWPGGRYKTYTRLYVPEGSEISSIQFANTDLTPESVTPVPELGLTEIALYYEVPIASNSLLQLKLRGGQIIPTQSAQSSLTINWLKQSGTGDDPIDLNLNYPSTLTPTQISLPADNPPQQLNFSTLLKANLSFAVQFRKN